MVRVFSLANYLRYNFIARSVVNKIDFLDIIKQICFASYAVALV